MNSPTPKIGSRSSSEAARTGVPLAPGTSLGDTYTVTRLIGRGGMGEVYEASHGRLGGRFAVKVIRRDVFDLDPVAYQRFQREANAMASLRHPNIVQIVDFNRAPDGSAFIAMEYLEGCDLKTRLREKGRLPVVEVVALLEQAASALAAAHDRGVIHRDLKPANLFLVPLPVAIPGLPAEYLKILDFGIAKMASSETLTNVMGILGTVHYMAPEQIEGVDEIDGRADQFAMACIGYELLAGRKPFFSDTVEGVMYSIVHSQPRRLPPTVDEAVEAVIFRALAKERSGRFPTMEAFTTALREAAQPNTDRSESMSLAGDDLTEIDARMPEEIGTARSADSSASLSLAEIVAVRTKRSLERLTSSGRVKRRTGAVLALLSTFGVGLFVTRRFAAPTSPEADAATLAETAALRAGVRARVEQTLSDELKTIASMVRAATKIPELRSAARFPVDALTFNDLFASEDWWLPYRSLSTVVLDGDRSVFMRQVTEPADARDWQFWSRSVRGEVTSALVLSHDRAYLAAGAALGSKGTVALVLGKPLNATRLRRLAKLSEVARIVVTDGTQLFGWPEDAASESLARILLDATKRGRETELRLPNGQIALALPRPENIWIWAITDAERERAIASTGW
ncbi:MAG TPA: serine/threonine-protein kinase [Polyangia bacterium]